MSKPTCAKHTSSGTLLEVEMLKKVDAIVARSVFPNQNGKSRTWLDHCWTFNRTALHYTTTQQKLLQLHVQLQLQLQLTLPCNYNCNYSFHYTTDLELHYFTLHYEYTAAAATTATGAVTTTSRTSTATTTTTLHYTTLHYTTPHLQVQLQL